MDPLRTADSTNPCLLYGCHLKAKLVQGNRRPDNSAFGRKNTQKEPRAMCEANGQGQDPPPQAGPSLPSGASARRRLGNRPSCAFLLFRAPRCAWGGGGRELASVSCISGTELSSPLCSFFLRSSTCPHWKHLPKTCRGHNIALPAGKRSHVSCPCKIPQHQAALSKAQARPQVAGRSSRGLHVKQESTEFATTPFRDGS